MIKHHRYLPLAAACLFGLYGCSDSNNNNSNNDDNTAGYTGLETLGKSVTTHYDGANDGLLAGLGLSGLQTAPSFYADATAPQTAEIRRNAIQANYVALVDQSAAGGFGTLYGPKDDTTFAGSETLAFIGEGINRATIMVQIPNSFKVDSPCIVAAPSSGSRGVYGAVGTGGAWGLEKGCAVAYTDANKGTGAIELTQNKGYGLQLDLLDLANTDQEASFLVPTQDRVTNPSSEYGGVTLPTQAALDSYVQGNPNRFAFKHAHSQKNIEKDWGLHTIQSVKFAFKLLNDKFDKTFNADNTLVMGASVSNGGSALLRAVEQDTDSLFDGIVVGEPNINPQTAPQAFSIAMGNRDVVNNHSKSAYEYFLLGELYAGCASKDPANSGSLFAELRGDTAARCDALVAAGLLTDGSYEEEGAEATKRLNDAGFLTESNKLLVGYSGIDLFQSLLATYGNAYTRSSVVDNLCNISMAHVVAGTTAPAAKSDLATLSALSNGIPRTADLYLIKDDAAGGPAIQIAAASTNGVADYNFEGAACWKDLWDNTSNPLHSRLMKGIDEIKGTGDLKGTPTVVVHGRDDALIPVNHSSRPYYALNKQREGDKSQLRYYEIKHSQHLDTLNQLYASAGMQYVPIDYYFKQGLELMYTHLTEGKALPPSQVVQTIAPSGNLTQADLPAVSAEATDLIIYENNRLVVPE